MVSSGDTSVLRPASVRRVETQTRVEWEAALERNAITLSRIFQVVGLRRDWAELEARKRLPSVI